MAMVFMYPKKILGQEGGEGTSTPSSILASTRALISALESSSHRQAVIPVNLDARTVTSEPKISHLPGRPNAASSPRRPRRIPINHSGRKVTTIMSSDDASSPLSHSSGVLGQGREPRWDPSHRQESPDDETPSAAPAGRRACLRRRHEAVSQQHWRELLPGKLRVR